MTISDGEQDTADRGNLVRGHREASPPNHPHRTTTAACHDARLAWRVTKLPTAEGMRMAGTTELSAEDLQTVLGLIKDADSVELKLTIHESARADAARALGVDPLDSQIRQVFFFDTPELALNAAGVVVRARRRQNEEGDTVVKLRPVVPNELAEELRASKSFNVEVDAMPGGFVCSASFKGVADNRAIREAAAGDRPIRKLFSKEQREFYAAHAPDGVELDTLSVLGPIPIIKVKVEPEGFGRRLVGEMWMYPDGSQIVELSTKARPDEAFQVVAEAKAFLHARGIDLTGEQQTKTKTALEFFSGASQPA
jgi:hypothetical protein